MEMLLATAWNGMAYALFSGQPLTVRRRPLPFLLYLRHVRALSHTGPPLC